ncbi:MAG: hypothetical protein DDT20_01721 [Firmicutes bacterium]|nr:hypothetical protein [Bacillota bacterium]
MRRKKSGHIHAQTGCAFVIAYSGTGMVAEPLAQGQRLRAVKLEAAVSVV